MKVIEVTVYEFNELSADAKEKARIWWREMSEFDPDLEDARAIADIFGIAEFDIAYSGFWSQGDGASFTGMYNLRADSCDDIRKYAPNDKELHVIASALEQAQTLSDNKLQVKIRRCDHRYFHENTVTFDICRTDGEPVTRLVEDLIKESMRCFMKWIYKSLEDQYEYIMSNDQVDETLIENGYSFYKNGSFFGHD